VFEGSRPINGYTWASLYMDPRVKRMPTPHNGSESVLEPSKTLFVSILKWLDWYTSAPFVEQMPKAAHTWFPPKLMRIPNNPVDLIAT
jgi:hypothetical protein